MFLKLSLLFESVRMPVAVHKTIVSQSRKKQQPLFMDCMALMHVLDWDWLHPSCYKWHPDLQTLLHLQSARTVLFLRGQGLADRKTPKKFVNMKSRFCVDVQTALI